jgi:hypothetical protein
MMHASIWDFQPNAIGRNSAVGDNSQYGVTGADALIVG